MMEKEKQKRLNKKHFEMHLNHLIKELGYDYYQLELEEDTYNIVFKNENFSIFFDDFNFIEPYFLHFFMKGTKIFTLWKKETHPQNEMKPNKMSYLREEKDLKRLKENKEKINKLIQINKKISITNIAQELGITRQGLYKNQELMELINKLKSVN